LLIFSKTPLTSAAVKRGAMSHSPVMHVRNAYSLRAPPATTDPYAASWRLGLARATFL